MELKPRRQKRVVGFAVVASQMAASKTGSWLRALPVERVELELEQQVGAADGGLRDGE